MTGSGCVFKFIFYVCCLYQSAVHRSSLTPLHMAEAEHVYGAQAVLIIGGSGLIH